MKGGIVIEFELEWCDEDYHIAPNPKEQLLEVKEIAETLRHELCFPKFKVQVYREEQG